MEELVVTSPIDGQEVGRVAALSKEAAHKEVQRAVGGQAAWQARSLEERGTIVRAAAQTLRDNVDKLSELLIQEIGKTPPEARDEVLRSADLMDYTVAEAGKLTDYVIKSEDFPGTGAGRVQTVTKLPLGTVLAIAPFNYPINLAISKIAPALVMGNTVVFKPPTQGSVSGARMVELFHAAGVPEDALVLVTGAGSSVGDALVTDPGIAMVAMTGSTVVGQKLAKLAGMIPLMLELGGNDAAIVLADADLDRAAAAITNGAFKYAGQRCTAVKRVYVEEAVADALVEKLVEQRAAHFGSAGDPRQHPVGPVINDKQAEYLQELFDDSVRAGGKVVAGGGRKGRAWEATIIDGLSHESRLVGEEQFGPILPIVRVASAEEAIRLANDSEYGLQACLFTGRADAERLARQLQVGGVRINDEDKRGPDNFLFVGHKQSGLGSQGVRFALEAMTKDQGLVRSA